MGRTKSGSEILDDDVHCRPQWTTLPTKTVVPPQSKYRNGSPSNFDAAHSGVANPSLTSSSVTSLRPEFIEDGCVILGKGGENGHRYATRYVIRRKQQREELCGEVIRETFAPCSLEENRESTVKCLWSAFSSESFIFTLHMSVLALGVSKEALNLRTVDEDLHLIHSSVETFVTILTIIICSVSIRGLFKDLKEQVTSVEHVSNPSSDNIRGRALRVWIRRFYALCIFLIITAITCFILFYFFAHLGWTIMSNNFCLVLVTLSSNLLLDRLNLITSRIREDQHKAVIFETMLLLQEAQTAFNNGTHKAFLGKADRFSKALVETEMFNKPEHIDISNKFETNTNIANTITTMEMQSMV